MSNSQAMTVDMVNGHLLKNIWIFSVPLMLTNLVQMMFNAADVVVVGRFAGQQALDYVCSKLRKLKLLYGADVVIVNGENASKSGGVAAFGKLKGMALPLLFFPASFLSATSTLLIPEISSAVAAGQTGRMQAAVRRSFGATCVLAICIGGAFFAGATPIARLVYGDDEVGGILRVLAPIVPFMYLESIADGMLKALNQQVQSLKYNCIDLSVRILLVFWLVP